MAKRSSRVEPVPPHLQSLSGLPRTITTPDGQEHNVVGDVWILPEEPGLAATVKFDWTLLMRVTVIGDSMPVMSAQAVSLAKLYILERMGAVRNSIKPNSGKGILRAMLHFARWLAMHPEWLPAGRRFDWGDLTAEIFDAWLTVEYRTKRKGSSATLVRRFYLWGADPDANRPGFSATLASVLSAQRLKKIAIGELVESRDKRRGPFTREELSLIFEACETGAGEKRDRALAWTLLLTAIRPKQIYLLTNRDLETIEGTAKESDLGTPPMQTTYRLRVRKIKRRSNAIEYHFLALSEGCARLLHNIRRPGSGPDDPLFWWLCPCYVDHIERSLRSFSEQANLRSPRLRLENSEPGGHLYDLMPLTPRRFRYGIATDRIGRGETPDNVATMLGHKGTECLHVYVETSPGIADDFQRATDYAIRPLIDLMEGRAHPSEVNLLVDVAPLVSPQLRPYGEAPIFRRGDDEATIFKRGVATYHYCQGQKRRKPLDVSLHAVPALDKSDARIKEIIAWARRKLPILYPNQDFDAQLWDVAHLKERPNTIGTVTFGFTTLTSTLANRNRLSLRPEDAIHPYFADVIKSWLIISNNVSLGFNVERLNAARHFWNFLSIQGNKRIASFCWRTLSEGDILAFEQYLMAYRTKQGEPLSPSTILPIIKHIQRLIDFLASYGICRHINYIPQTPPARLAAIRLLDAKKLTAERKLPAPGVLEHLGGLYHRITTAPAVEVNDWLLIIISAIAILMLTGLRIGELVTLPFDCEVEDKQMNGQPGESYSYRYGIRYWVEKGKKTLRVKWISPTAESVIRASVARIKGLTAAARERAKVLEADPTRVTLPPEIASRTVLDKSELLALIGHKKKDPVRTNPQGLLPLQGRGIKSYYYVKDLEAYLMSRRVSQLYTIRHDDGTFQMLSESLFIIFAKQSQCWHTDPCRLLVEPIKALMIANHLSRPRGVFKTYGYSEWTTKLSANPHCFRHWLIHVAYKGGMETHLLLRYFGKRYACSVADYLHFSTDESDAYAPEELSAERFYAPV
jgi:integrase